MSEVPSKAGMVFFLVEIFDKRAGGIGKVENRNKMNALSNGGLVNAPSGWMLALADFEFVTLHVTL